MNNKLKGMFDLTKTTFYTNTTNGRGHSKTSKMIEQLQLRNTQLKSVLKEIREFIEIEKEAGILHTERSTNVILEIIDKGIGEDNGQRL